MDPLSEKLEQNLVWTASQAESLVGENPVVLPVGVTDSVLRDVAGSGRIAGVGRRQGIEVVEARQERWLSYVAMPGIAGAA